MENSFLITKCMLRPNEGSSLKEDYDIVAGNPIIDYYESIESPSISMTITFIDIDQVIGRKGITGGEYIDVIVKTGDDDADDFKITAEKQKLMLNSVRNMVTESNKQVATLEFVSVESIVNETARVNKNMLVMFQILFLNYLLVTRKESEQVKNYLARKKQNLVKLMLRRTELQIHIHSLVI